MIATLTEDTPTNRALAHKHLELHSKLAGHFATDIADQGQVIFITREKNWEEAVRDQQENLVMPDEQ